MRVGRGAPGGPPAGAGGPPAVTAGGGHGGGLRGQKRRRWWAPSFGSPAGFAGRWFCPPPAVMPVSLPFRMSRRISLGWRVSIGIAPFYLRPRRGASPVPERATTPSTSLKAATRSEQDEAPDPRATEAYAVVRRREPEEGNDGMRRSSAPLSTSARGAATPRGSRAPRASRHAARAASRSRPARPSVYSPRA